MGQQVAREENRIQSLTGARDSWPDKNIRRMGHPGHRGKAAAPGPGGPVRVVAPRPAGVISPPWKYGG